MTGKTNQVQTPMGSGVQAILETAVNTESGLGLIPANPSVSVGGQWPGSMFTVWEAVSLAAGNYTPVLLAQYNSAAANGVGTALPATTTLNMGSIQQLNNALSGTIPTLTSLVASNLIQFSSDFTIVTSALTTLTLTNLKYIGGQFVATMASLTSFSLPALVAINGACTPTIASATSISMPLLTWIGTNFNVGGAACTSLDVSSLQYVGGLFQPAFANLATFNLPAIVSIGSTVQITAANLVTFSFGSTLKKVSGNVTMTGMKLSQASVDGILVSLAALDGTNGTTAYSSLTVNLSGGTSSAPSATGLTAKATLQARSCTVTTN